MDLRQILIEERDKLLAEMRMYGFFLDRAKRFDATTWDINNGHCEDFADAVESRCPSVSVIWLEDSEPSLNHCVIRFQGRYYDAECIDGVEHPSQLPIAMNMSKTRPQVLSERRAYEP